MNKFRTLRADEIDCRIAQVKTSGLSLLLYKDARVDQNILDETVGPLNWQRHHSRDNANCIVSIWDAEKQQWVEKEDTGTESNTEKEKGLASDSFKRACFNWGIGRELYTAPFVFIPKGSYTVTDGGKCYDKFSVSEIGYDDTTWRNINKLVIRNNKLDRIVFNWQGKDAKPLQPDTDPGDGPAKPKAAPAKIEQITEMTNFQIAIEWCNTVGIPLDSFKEYVKAAIRNGAVPAKKVNDMTDKEFNNLLKWVNANAGTVA